MYKVELQRIDVERENQFPLEFSSQIPNTNSLFFFDLKFSLTLNISASKPQSMLGFLAKLIPAKTSGRNCRVIQIQVSYFH